MQISDLTAEEIELIKQRRASQQLPDHHREFQREAISTALRFLEWSERTGYGLTFSTFVNQFEYEGLYTGDVYRAVERIMKAALISD